MLLLITISTFICISLALMGVYWLLYKPQSAATERLKRLGGRQVNSAAAPISLDENRPGAEFAERIASPLNRLLACSSAAGPKKKKKNDENTGPARRGAG